MCEGEQHQPGGGEVLTGRVRHGGQNELAGAVLGAGCARESLIRRGAEFKNALRAAEPSGCILVVPGGRMIERVVMQMTRCDCTTIRAEYGEVSWRWRWSQWW